MAWIVGLRGLRGPIGCFNTNLPFQLTPCLSSYGTQKCENEIWPVAAKAVWCWGVSSLTTHTCAEAATLLGRTPECLKGCHDGCNRGVFLIIWGVIVHNLCLYYWKWWWCLLALNHIKRPKIWSEGVGHDDLAAIAVIMYFGSIIMINNQCNRKWYIMIYQRRSRAGFLSQCIVAQISRVYDGL